MLLCDHFSCNKPRAGPGSIVVQASYFEFGEGQVIELHDHRDAIQAHNLALLALNDLLIDSGVISLKSMPGRSS